MNSGAFELEWKAGNATIFDCPDLHLRRGRIRIAKALFKPSSIMVKALGLVLSRCLPISSDLHADFVELIVLSPDLPRMDSDSVYWGLYSVRFTEVDGEPRFDGFHRVDEAPKR